MWKAFWNNVSTVKPSHEAFIEPTKKNADIIIPGDREFDKVLYMLNGYLLYEFIAESRGQRAEGGELRAERKK